MRSWALVLSWVCLVCWIYALPPESIAGLAIDWGGDYVSASQPFQDRHAGHTGGFDASGNPKPISPAANYAGTSAAFYGAVTQYSGAVRSDFGLILENAAADRIELKNNSNGADTTAYVAVWCRTTFLNGLDAETVGLDGTCTARVNIATYTPSSGIDGRFVLGKGATYYISEGTFTTAADVSRVPAALSWFQYDPATALTNIGTAASIVTDGLISGITEFGLYFLSRNTGSDAVRVQDFEVQMVAIPRASGATLLIR
jgi:hypothetical protein